MFILFNVVVSRISVRGKTKKIKIVPEKSYRLDYFAVYGFLTIASCNTTVEKIIKGAWVHLIDYSE